MGLREGGKKAGKDVCGLGAFGWEEGERDAEHPGSGSIHIFRQRNER